MASPLLSIGQQCSAPHCNIIDFLPILCPTCERVFCSTHIHGQEHECFHSRSEKKTTSQDFVVAARCHLDECDDVTMEAAGLTRRSDIDVDPIGRQVRCPGCHQAFCVSHRHQEAHNCTAPTHIEAYEQAKTDRKQAAKQAIQSVLPSHNLQEIPKAPAGKVVGGLKAEEKLGRKLDIHNTIANATTTATPVLPQTKSSLPKSKEDKLRAIALMKLKSKAIPGSAAVAQLPMPNRWYISWYWDESGESLNSGKASASASGAQAQAVWFDKDATVGRIIDDLARSKNIINSPHATHVAQNLHLVRLQSVLEPNLLDAASRLSDTIPQGETVALVRGRQWQDQCG